MSGGGSTDGTGDPADRAMELADRARENPGAVDPEQLRELLDDDSSRARWYAIQALRTAASSGTVDLSTFVDQFVRELDGDESRVRGSAASALADVAARTPTAAVDAVDEMASLLETDEGLSRTTAADFFHQLAEASHDPDSDVGPEVVEPAISGLRSLLEDSTQRGTAIQILGAVADRYGDRIVADTETFLEAFGEQAGNGIEMNTRNVDNRGAKEKLRELNDTAKTRERGIRIAAGEALVGIARADPDRLRSEIPRLAEYVDGPTTAVRSITLELFEVVGAEHPETVEPYLDDIGERLEDGDGVRERAVLALTAVSQSNPEGVAGAVEPHHDALVDLLDHPVPTVRGAAVGLLSYLAEESPETVAPGRIRPMLDDEHAYVRGNAVWTLGYLGDEAATERIRELVESDPDPDVRSAADAALDRLQ